MQIRGPGQVLYANHPRGAGGACVPGGQWEGFSDACACVAAPGAGPEPRQEQGLEAGAGRSQSAFAS